MRKDTKQLKLWKSDFGDRYTDRNAVDPNSRVSAFKHIIEGIKVGKILEVGSNAGHNLIAFSKIGNFELTGIEPNKYAILKGRQSSKNINILEGNVFNIPFADNYFDLVFTCGVLIHIALKDVPKALDEIYRVSNKYILTIEYFAEKETVIPYRGHDDALWKRDFRKCWLKRYPDLVEVKSGYLGTEDGFDRCNWILFEK